MGYSGADPWVAFLTHYHLLLDGNWWVFVNDDDT